MRAACYFVCEYKQFSEDSMWLECLRSERWKFLCSIRMSIVEHIQSLERTSIKEIDENHIKQDSFDGNTFYISIRPVVIVL